MRVVNWLFDSRQATTKPMDAIRWWELRRVPYNLIVGAVGIASIVVMEFLGNVFLPPGEDFVEPLGLILGILVFGLLANLAYTLAWVVELRVSNADPGKHRVFRTQNFRKGLAWSCALASAPIWLSVVAWVVQKTTK
jgi:hypothetical protein